MPRVKTAAFYARERLETGTDISAKERINLLRIIAADDKRKAMLERTRMLHPTCPKPKAKKDVAPVLTPNIETPQAVQLRKFGQVRERTVIEALRDIEAEEEVEDSEFEEPESELFSSPAAKPEPERQEFKY